MRKSEAKNEKDKYLCVKCRHCE